MPRLDFVTADKIQVKPRDPVDIVVEVKQSGPIEVKFALLSAPGETHDGVLDRSSTFTDANGRARVLLTAPSTPVQLILRASVGAVSKTATITVTASGSTILIVQPRYDGPRQVTEWIASVHVDKRCEDLMGVFDDGDRVGVASIAQVQVRDVPVGVPLAITLRAGHFLSGCTTDRVLEGPPIRVVVPISAVPLNLEASVLDVVFGLEASDAALETALERTLVRAAVALRTGAPGATPASNDVSALLDAMQAGLSATQAEAFALARSAEDWDARVASALDDPSGSRLTEALKRWSTIGRGALLSPHAFEGRLQGSSTVAGAAMLTIDRAAGVAASELGIAAEPDSMWEADGSDKLAFGGSISWIPSKLSAALAIAPALAETGALGIDQALQRLYACSTVAQAMSPTATQNGAAFTGCDAMCVETLCRGGMSALWDRVKNFSGAELERLELTAVGDAFVGDEAQAIELRATWVGRLTSVPDASTGGDLRGFAPRPETR